MKIRIKSVKSKIIVFFIGLAAFQICVMAGFAKLQLEPSIVSMYSEHLERFADVALTETTQETEKIERYMVNIIGDARFRISSAERTRSRVQNCRRCCLQNFATGFLAIQITIILLRQYISWIIMEGFTVILGKALCRPL